MAIPIYQVGTFEMSSIEVLPLGIDVTQWLLTGETLASVTTSLTLYNPDAPTKLGASVPGSLSGSPSIVGNIVVQTVTSLTPNTQYRLRYRVTTSTSKVWGPELILLCTG